MNARICLSCFIWTGCVFGCMEEEGKSQRVLHAKSGAVAAKQRTWRPAVMALCC